jgi:hypothetical protein
MKEGAVNGSFPAQNSATELHSAKVETVLPENAPQ